MITNSSIPLDIVFQQCYDLTNLDPGKNKEACLSCFQGIYAALDRSISVNDLAAAIFGAWGSLMNAGSFRDAMTAFKNADGSQAFDNYDISLLVSKYYLKESTVHFNYPGRISSVPANYQFVETGNAGADGVLTKIVASTELTDQGWGGTWGSDWRIFLSRDNVTVAEALYVVSNPDHRNPQHLRNAEHIFEPPARVLSTDKVILGAAKWYPGHEATIVNTSFDLFITAIENLTRLSAPQDITFGYSTEEGFKIGWGTVKGNYGYEVRITDWLNKDIIAATAIAKVNINSIHIPLSNITRTCIGYTVIVKAIGVIEKLNSEFGDSHQTVSTVQPVTDIKIALDRNKLAYVIDWYMREEDDGYELSIREKGLVPRPVLMLSVDKGGAPFILPISKISGYNHNTIFQVSVQAKQNRSISSEWITIDLPKEVILAKMDWRIPGDKLLIFESGSGLYWLSWNAAATLTRSQMEEQLRDGQQYSGFQYASKEQVEALLRAAGVDTRSLGPMMMGDVVRTVDNTVELLGVNNYDRSYRSNKSAQAYLSSSGVVCVSVAWTTHPPSAWIMFSARDPIIGHALVSATKPGML